MTQSAHLVLARRYRPQSLNEVVGQTPVVHMLEKALQGRCLGQALLFHGVRGVGKTTLARLLARILNCQDPEAMTKAQACQTCASCRALQDGHHMDVTEMDAASHTSVDDIRPLIESAPYRPQMSAFKIYIIDEVHMLSKSAFNALLKTLEEPPPHMYLIFATTEIRRLPATFLSRCLRFDLRPMSFETLWGHLQEVAQKEGLNIEDDALRLLAQAADGSVRDGLSLLETVAPSGDECLSVDRVRHLLGIPDTKDLFDVLEALIKGDGPTMLKNVRSFSGEPGAFLHEFLTCIHHMTEIKMGVTTPLPSSMIYATDTLKSWSNLVSLPWLLRVWQVGMKGLEDLKQALNPAHVLDMTLTLCSCIQEREGSGDVSPPSPVAPVHPPEDHTSADCHAINLPATFLDVVALFESKKEMILGMALRYHVELVDYQPGCLAIHLLPDADKDLPTRLSRCLQSWTGYAWQVSVSNERGQPSLGEQGKAEKKERSEQALQQPVAQAIQNAFPGSQVNDLSTSI